MPRSGCLALCGVNPNLKKKKKAHGLILKVLVLEGRMVTVLNFFPYSFRKEEND